MFHIFRDGAGGSTRVNNTATLEYMKATFTDHYNNKRQPIGLYTHPIHLSVRYKLSFTWELLELSL